MGLTFVKGFCYLNGCKIFCFKHQIWGLVPPTPRQHRISQKCVGERGGGLGTNKESIHVIIKVNESMLILVCLGLV